MAYVTIKAAFNSVNQLSLWRAFRGIGVPDIVLKPPAQCTSTVHTGTKVRSGRKLSRRFCTSSGVRQGCVLAQALFCIAIDWILGHLVPEAGITAGEHHFTDLAYADDAVIFLTYEGHAGLGLNISGIFHFHFSFVRLLPVVAACHISFLLFT